MQAYQRRASSTIERLIALAQRHRRRLNIRLVKGAYWDSEIKRAQERGLVTYPVFTRKASTDVSYLACARSLMESDPALVYPQFATHNAHTVAYVLTLAADSHRPFEFQRLHGMGHDLYEQLVHGACATCGVQGVCARGFARRTAAVPGAPAAGERREHLLRQSHRG